MPEAKTGRRTALLVGSRALRWDAVRHAIQSDRQLRIVGDVTLAAEAVPLTAAEHPDLILLTQELPETSLPGLVSTLLVASRESQVVVLCDEVDPSRARQCETVGVGGYIALRDLDQDSLLGGLHAVLAGCHVFSVGADHSQLGWAGSHGDESRIHLSPLETRILGALLADRTENEIACKEGAGRRTIQAAVQRLKRKFGARTLAGLANRAWECGFPE